MSTTIENDARSEDPNRPTNPIREAGKDVVMTLEEREIGLKTKLYFDRTLKRQTPWLIKNGTITFEARDTVHSAERHHPDGMIRGEDLEAETISPLLASVLFTFKRVEDKLPDYSRHGADVFRNIWGINNSYHQWSFEENQHSDAIGLLLERTGSYAPDVLQADYTDNLLSSWEPPFSTGRRMVLYAAFQEQLTSLSYHAVARRAMEEGAPLVAEVMQLIARDEAYHGGGYRAFSRIYAEQDLEATIDDAVHVANNFEMPALHLMRNRRRDSVEIVRVGAFSREMVSEETLLKVLLGLGFVPEQLSRATAAAYWQERRH